MRWAPGDRSNIEDMRGRSGGRVATVGIGGFLVRARAELAHGNQPVLVARHRVRRARRKRAARPARRRHRRPKSGWSTSWTRSMRDAQSTWSQVLGNRYQPTRVVLFRDAIDSACGSAQSATGPFYCPSDQKVYLDLGFFAELDQRFGAPGDFAQAYVITHELGHHVQNLLGFTERAQQDRRSGPNSASVALELQADCFAGIWGHAASQSGRFQAGGVELEPGDADEALRAAASIGDDRLQKMSDRPRDAGALYARQLGAARRSVPAWDGIRTARRLHRGIDDYSCSSSAES